MAAALRVVVVRDDDEVESEWREQVEAVDPVGGLANLIYLVHGKGELAKDDRRRTGEGAASASAEMRPDQLGDERSAPLPRCIRGAAGTGEDVAGLTELVVEALDRERIRGVPSRSETTSIGWPTLAWK